MAFDLYKAALATAAWSWRECKVCPWHFKPRNKDRASGRAAKRSARQRHRVAVELGDA